MSCQFRRTTTSQGICTSDAHLFKIVSRTTCARCGIFSWKRPNDFYLFVMTTSCCCLLFYLFLFYFLLKNIFWTLPIWPRVLAGCHLIAWLSLDATCSMCHTGIARTAGRIYGCFSAYICAYMHMYEVAHFFYFLSTNQFTHNKFTCKCVRRVGCCNIYAYSIFSMYVCMYVWTCEKMCTCKYIGNNTDIFIGR